MANVLRAFLFLIEETHSNYQLFDEIAHDFLTSDSVFVLPVLSV